MCDILKLVLVILWFFCKKLYYHIIENKVYLNDHQFLFFIPNVGTFLLRRSAIRYYAHRLFSFRTSATFCFEHSSFYVRNIRYFSFRIPGRLLLRTSGILYFELPVFSFRTFELFHNSWVAKRTSMSDVRNKKRGRKGTAPP